MSEPNRNNQKENTAVNNVVMLRDVIASELPKKSSCKECCSKCSKDICGCFRCCVKSWSCCLNGVQGICNVSAAGCMMCSTFCTGCSNCIEEIDCDGK